MADEDQRNTLMPNPINNDGQRFENHLMALWDITQVTEENRKENDLSRTYLTIAGVILLALDINGRIISINNKGCEILEAPESELVGTNWFETCLPRASVEQARQLFKRLTSGRTASSFDVEGKVLTRKGNIKVVVWHNTAVRNDLGEIIGTLSSGTDITRRKVVEEELRHERDTTKQVMETSPVGIVRVAADGQIVYANRQAEKTLGIGKAQITDRIFDDPSWRITDLDGGPFPREDLPFNVVQCTGKPVFEIQHAIEWPDGSRVLLSINAAPLFDGDGTFDGMVAAIENITSKVEAEKKHLMLFNEMIDGCSLHEVICDDQMRPVDYRFLDINPAFERLTGLRREDVIGRTVLNVLPNTEPYWIETFGNVAVSGEPVFFENYSQEIGRYFQVTAFQPAANQFACIFVDITERKESEDALKQSEASLLTAQKIAKLGNWSWQIDTGRIHWSDQMFRILGYRPQSIKPTADLYWHRVHPDDMEKERAASRMALESQGKAYETEHRVLLADGTERYVFSRGMVTSRDETGKPLLMVGTTQDITERKWAEQALQKSEEKHRSILETAMDGFCLADRQGRLLEVNQTFCRMLGYSESELLTMGIQDLEAAESAEEVIAHQQAITEQGEDRFESLARRKDGTTFDIEVCAQYRDSDGGQFICFVRDITETKKMEARLAQAQKMESIGNLAGGIAHDFNNILFPIIGLAEMLSYDSPIGSPEHRSALEILKAGKRGASLIKQILAFSRRSENKKVPVRFQQILQEVLNLIRSTIPSSIRINFNIEQDCGMIMADATQLHQIAMNLITNAYHAVENEYGQIDVRLEEVALTENETAETTLNAGRYALFSVSDAGSGIDPEIRDKIFEPYFTTKEQGKGTGLGLAVVFGIVKDHGGEIQVASEVGAGTTVSVYFPLIERSASFELNHTTIDTQPAK